MTKAQERMINRIRSDAENMHGSGGYEVKEWQIKELDCGAVSLYLSVGRIGDEGTLAEIIDRNRLHLFIGPRGGTQIPCYARRKNGMWHNFYEKYTDISSACSKYEAH